MSPARDKRARDPGSSGVWGIVLAAGPSHRFEAAIPKQLLRFGDQPLVRRAVIEALGADLAGVVVVLGHAADEVREVLAGLDVLLVENRDYLEGQSLSVKTGLQQVAAAARAVLFIPCDQPFLTHRVLNQIVAAYRQSGGPIVVPTHKGRRGSPALFDRSLFAELATIGGDRGGRQLFASHAQSIVEVELERGEPLLDIDTWDDFQRLIGMS